MNPPRGHRTRADRQPHRTWPALPGTPATRDADRLPAAHRSPIPACIGRLAPERPQRSRAAAPCLNVSPRRSIHRDWDGQAGRTNTPPWCASATHAHAAIRADVPRRSAPIGCSMETTSWRFVSGNDGERTAVGRMPAIPERHHLGVALGSPSRSMSRSIRWTRTSRPAAKKTEGRLSRSR